MNSWEKYSLSWYSNVKFPEGDCVVPRCHKMEEPATYSSRAAHIYRMVLHRHMHQSLDWSPSYQ
jgi:hypothetical protein